MESVNKSYRVLNLEGAWLEQSEGEFIYNTNDNNRLYSATIPYSLETIRAFNKLPQEIFEDDEELFTKLFVNFKFTKDYLDENEEDDIETKINKKRLRKLIYTSIVKIDNVEYCFFKRGASKARTANVIFCKKEYYEMLYNPCLLGLKFKIGEEYDITSKEAYTSLIMSGIIGTIEIKPEEILIINDLESPSFKAKQTITTRDKEGNIYQDKGTFDVINNMTDGQGLMDESVYIENKLLNTTTCALLRNDFCKVNACRTRLQEFWNGREVWDAYRGWMDSKRIKLVITPSSCKYLKFSEQFRSEKECFLDWLNRIPSTFGVVKVDHVGNYGYSNRLSYQMLNSMNISRDEVKKLIQDELDYFKLMKDNTLKTSAEIRKMNKKDKCENRKLRNKMSCFLDLVQNKENNELTTGDMITDLLNRNSDFRFTKKFKDWKNEQLQDYIANLRLGKIRIKNSIYAIMISCPYEMLIATTTENNRINSSIMDGWECYCPTFGDKKELLGIRNPQINAGNVGFFTNKYYNEFKWFGYYEDGQPKHEFVVFVNTYNNDLMNRLQGADFDIDTVYLTDNSLLVSKAKDNQSWATPANGIEGSKDKKEYTHISIAELDNYLGGSTMAIGKIVNKSAIFNGYMYDGINNNLNEDYINKCYEASSTLSSFSQIAIDMAKKNFRGLSLTKEMKLLNKKTYLNNKGEEEQILQFEYDKANAKTIPIEEYNSNNHYIIRKLCIREKGTKKYINMYEVVEKKMVVPYFFKYIAKDNSYRIPTKMKCSMDYLQEILDGVDTKALQTDKVDIEELFVMQKDLTGRAYNKDKIDKAREVIDCCDSVLNKNIYCKADSAAETRLKSNFRKWAKKEAVKQLIALDLNDKTVYRILLRAFNLDTKYQGKVIYKLNKNGEKIYCKNKEVLKYKELKEMTMLILNLIYKSYPASFTKCFKEKKMSKIRGKSFWNGRKTKNSKNG